MSEEVGWTYARAGVDRKQIEVIQRRTIEALLRQPKRGLGGLHVFGEYASTLRYGGLVIAAHADGVGTKALLATEPSDYRKIGMDAVTINVNDLVCVGSRPLAVLDYVALAKPSPEVVENVIEGMLLACRECGARLIGGETAVMPGLYADERYLDVVAFVVGVIEENSRRLADVRKGDVLIGIASSGLHCNGFSLVRRLLLEERGYRLDDHVEEIGARLKEELLRPAKMYYKLVRYLLSRGPRPTGIAHVTGGGFVKLRRLVKRRRLKIVLDSMPEPPLIFKLIQKEGKIDRTEMYRTFNMGVGMVMAFREEDVEEALKRIGRMGERAWRIGRVEVGEGVYLDDARLDV